MTTARAGGVVAALIVGGLSAMVNWGSLTLFFADSLGGLLVNFMLFMYFSVPMAGLGLVVVASAVMRLRRHYKFNPSETPQLPEGIDPKGLGMLAGGLALMGPLLSVVLYLLFN